MAKTKPKPKGLEQQLNEVEMEMRPLIISGKDKAALKALEKKRIELIKKLGRKP